MMDGGVRLGANTANALLASSSGKPTSALVGTFGMAGCRRASAIATVLTCPEPRYGNTAGRGTRAMLNCRVATACNAATPPL
jgi:hypothetical protein